MIAMITIHIDPTIFTLGPLKATWYGLMIALAILGGAIGTARLAKAQGISPDDVYTIALWAVPGGMVGARLFHVIDQWQYYILRPVEIFYINQGGLAIYGAIMGGTLVGIIAAKVMRISVSRLADAAAPALILAMAVGRVGNIINGEHHSFPTDLPWGVIYTHPNSFGISQYPTHPVVAYEILWDLLAFGILWWARRRLPAHGMLFLLYGSLYSSGRFFLSFLRFDAIILLGLRQAQILAILTLLICLPWMIYLGMRSVPRPKVKAKTRAR